MIWRGSKWSRGWEEGGGRGRKEKAVENDEGFGWDRVVEDRGDCGGRERIVVIKGEALDYMTRVFMGLDLDKNPWEEEKNDLSREVVGGSGDKDKVKEKEMEKETENETEKETENEKREEIGKEEAERRLKVLLERL
ncbi:hypothetical protein NHQ30_000122 [Ciborinia camelliae]|nr:hypothetical protein NHQ30_000122 [Ciborinia camelliae]